MSELSPRTLHLAAVLLLVLVPLIFFWQMIVGGQEPLAPDAQAVTPLHQWADEARGQIHEIPLWCPTIFSGMPSYGSFIYTPSSPLDLVRWLRQPVSNSRGARYYVTMLIGGLALYLLLLMRRCPQPAAAIGALLYIMTPYFLGSMAAGHSTKLHAMHLVPLVFLALEVLLRKRNIPAMAFLAAAVAFQLWNNHPQISYYTLLLAGLYMILVLIWDRPERYHGRGMALGIGLAVLALAFAAVLVLEPYLSVLQYTPYSVRGAPGALEGAAEGASGAGWDYATAWSYPFKELIAFFFPAWFGLEGGTYWGGLPFTQSTHYFGVAALVLAVIGLALGRGRRKWIELALAVFILLVGFGRNLALLYRPLYELLPFFDRFRVPSMIYSVLPFFVALLAADGISALMRGGAWQMTLAERRTAARPRGAGQRQGASAERGAKQKQLDKVMVAAAGDDTPRWGRRLLEAWPIITVILWVLVVIWTVAGGGIASAMRDGGAFVRPDDAQRYGTQIGAVVSQRMLLLRHSVVIGLLLLALTSAVIEARRRRILPGLWAAGLLGLVIIVDLWVIDRRFYAPQPRSETEAILQEDAVVRALRERERPFRVAPLTATEFSTNRYAAFGIESIGGYQAAKLRCYDDLVASRAIFSPPVLAMLNARYFIYDRPLPPQYSQLASTGSGESALYLFENPTALPRAWFADSARVAPDPATLLTMMGAPEFDAARLSWITPARGAALPAALSSGTVDEISTGINDLSARVRVTGPEPGLLVFSEIVYPPGWRAAIDGKVTTILTANHVLRSVIVPPGEHVVTMKANASARDWGRRLSLIAGAILIVLVAISRGGRYLRRIVPRNQQSAEA